MCVCFFTYSVLSIYVYYLVPLCVSDRSRCGAVLVLAGSFKSWQRDLMNFTKGPPMTILPEFHGAVSEVCDR